MPSTKPKYTRIEEYDYYIGFGFNLDNFYSALKYEPQPTDILICTYPKCGTTWMENIVYLILNDGNPVPEDKNIAEFMTFLEYWGKEAAESKPAPRIVKTHFPYRLVPKNNQAKYIFVTRNPKDCLVSFYHHTKGFVDIYDFADGKFDDFFEVFMSGEIESGDYFDFLLAWYAHRNDPNVLFMTYEELKKDIRNGILKVASFMGGQYGSKLVSNPEILEKIINNSAFTEMKKDKNHWNFNRPENATDFIRKGEIGDWRNHLNEEQSKRIDEKMRNKFEGTDIMKLWSDYI